MEEIRCLTQKDLSLVRPTTANILIDWTKLLRFESISDMLYSLYIDKGWGIRKIGEELDLSTSPLRTLLTKMNIPRKPFGGNHTGIDWNKRAHDAGYSDIKTALLEMRNEGLKNKEIGKRLGCGKDQASQLMNKHVGSRGHKIDYQLLAKNRGYESFDMLYMDWHNKGLRPREMAKRLGIGATSVYTYRRKNSCSIMGIPVRKSGAAK